MSERLDHPLARRSAPAPGSSCTSRAFVPTSSSYLRQDRHPSPFTVASPPPWDKNPSTGLSALQYPISCTKNNTSLHGRPYCQETERADIGPEPRALSRSIPHPPSLKVPPLPLIFEHKSYVSLSYFARHSRWARGSYSGVILRQLCQAVMVQLLRKLNQVPVGCCTDCYSFDSYCSDSYSYWLTAGGLRRTVVVPTGELFNRGEKGESSA